MKLPTCMCMMRIYFLSLEPLFYISIIKAIVAFLTYCKKPRCFCVICINFFFFNKKKTDSFFSCYFFVKKKYKLGAQHTTSQTVTNIII